MGPAEVNTPKTANHFTILTYGFQHSFLGKGRVESFQAVAGRWHHWWSRLNDGALATALDDINFFLPHVQRMLFPEALLPIDDNTEDRLAASRRFAGMRLDDVARLVSPDAALRLTYDPGRLAPLRRLELSFILKDRDGATLDQFAVPFEIEWVDAVLFPQQVGLLLVKVRLSEPEPSVARINDFHYYLRPIHAPKLDWSLADWRRPDDPPSVSPFKARDLVDYLLQGLSGDFDARSPSLNAAVAEIDRAKEDKRATATPFGNVYGQYFHLYHYSCLSGAEPPDWPSGPFDSPSERALYELATCTDTRLPDYLPDGTYLRDLLARHRIAIWDNWKGIALHDNVAFLGMHEGRFNLRDLPHNVESDYLNLYILTLFYKIRLSLMAGEMVGRDGFLGDRVRRARHLGEDFRRFQDDYWFVEVTHRPQGLEIHRRFLEGLGIGAVFEELRAKVREHQEFHELKLQRRVSDLLAVLTFIGVPAGALCSLFGSALVPKATWPQFFACLLGVWGVVGVLWLAWTHRDEILDDYRSEMTDQDARPR